MVSRQRAIARLPRRLGAIGRLGFKNSRVRSAVHWSIEPKHDVARSQRAFSIIVVP
jgi:hypothetical protein